MELGGVSAPVPFGGNVTDRPAMELSAVLPLSEELDPESACMPIAGQASVVRALGAVLGRVAASRIVVAVSEPFRAAVTELVGSMCVVIPVDPSSDWRAATQVGLEHLAVQPLSPVLLHDWRHPLAPSEVTARVVAELAAGHRVVVPVTAVTDSVKEVDADGAVIATVDRTTLLNVQYPRGFAAATLADLLARDTDPVAAALGAGEPVVTIDGHADAGRFTLPADAALLEAIITCRR